MGLPSPVAGPRLRAVGISSTLLLVAGLVAGVSAPAVADTAPPVAGTTETVATDYLPTAQINGVVWDQVVVGDTVYAAGDFTKARPAGAALGGPEEVSRSYLLSYTLSTGELTSWAPVLNAQVRALDVSPDGSRLYAVGQFTSVNGVTKNRIVAFSTATGAVDNSFTGSANGQVYAVTASASAVYIAGTFTAVSGQQRPGTAAAFTTAGAVLPWAPTISGGRAFALEVSPDNSKVVIAGNFTTLNGGGGNGTTGYGQGAVDTANGANVTWNVGTIVRNAGSDAAIYNLDSDGTSIYGTGYTFGAGGNLEGAFKASWSDGSLQWISNCSGDEYSIAAAAGAVYIAGHPHRCDVMGDFPQNNPWTWKRGLAFDPNATQTLSSGSFTGRPGTSVLAFYPNLNQGTFTGQAQGPWSVAGNASYVVYAGEFTQVNGQPQQGLARFAVKSIAPNKEAPVASGTGWTIDTQAYSSGSVRLSWIANYDRDNEQLTYRVIRDGNTASPIFTTSSLSRFWDRPTLTFVDSGLAPGSSHSYRVSATDPYGNVAWSATTTAVAGSSGTLSNYAKGVFADSPSFYFRLGETSGAATNWAGPVANTTQVSDVTQTMDATVGSAATRNVSGAISGDSNAAMRFTNSNNSRVYTTQQVWSDDSVSVEAWFKTTTASGKIVGFGSSSSSASSGTYDRHLYLNGGRVIWGVNDGSQRTLQSATGMNDGKWHQVVGTVSSAGMTLYVDGQVVGTRVETVKGQRYFGNWRIGGDSTWAGSQNFTGDIDEVAVYKNPLTAAKVLQHFQLGTGAAVANVAPTAVFTSTATTPLNATFSASGSSDSDGTIASYAWNFGDGTTGTGASAAHSYATAGSYSVTLTVTDDQGATGTVTNPVTVTAPPVVDPGGSLAQDSFSRTSVNGWGTAATGGSWTTAAANASYGVSSGVGVFSNTAGSTRRALLNSVLQNAATVGVSFRIDKPVSAGSTYAGVVARQVGSEYYQARARINVDGSVGLQIMRGQSTVIANVTTVAGLSYAVGDQLRVSFSAAGTSPTTLQAKVWKVGATEPATWQLTATDSTAALQASGSVGLESYVSGSATNAPIAVSFDEFSAVAPGGAPANQAPTAAFSSSVSNLTASVNGAGSTDPDGTIASWAWAFGDGTTGTGATASRTYAAAGTYTVTLTVTDDAGATATTTGSVTVTAPPVVVNPPLAQDAFERVVTAGWGSSDLGGAWSAAANSSYVVNSGSAAAVHTAGSTRHANLTGVSATATDLVVDVSLDKEATGGGAYAGAVGRQVGTSFYQARVRYVAGGTVGLQILSGSSTVLANTTVTGLTVTPGQQLRLRLLTTGTNPTTISAKVWAVGSAEPAAWQVTTTDSTAALQAAGSVGVESYVSGSATNAPLTVRFDNLLVSAP